MIDEGHVVWYLLTILAFAVALNLFLTLRLARVSLTTQFNEDVPLMLPAGEIVEDFEGANLVSGRQVFLSHNSNAAFVLLFLSSRCPTCRSKLPELARILPTASSAGIMMWFLSVEPAGRLTKFLEGSELLNHVFLIDQKVSEYLNPRSNAPSYIFLDAKREVQASGNIGDENWSSFLKQMDEIEFESADEYAG